jgi:Protein of unknown function (DUF4254)
MKNSIIEVEAVTRAQFDWTRRWHDAPTPPKTVAPWPAVEANHRMNFDLWHAEDSARRDDLGAAGVRDAKRTIDRCNQARNDAVERLDVWLLGQLPPMPASAPLHSETPGMIVDRLSIMTLKIYHMKIEANRETAGSAQREKCAQKCALLEEQHADLADCLKNFLAELRAGTRRFKLYRQFKMYNDVRLNPQLYQKSAN